MRRRDFLRRAATLPLLGAAAHAGGSAPLRWQRSGAGGLFTGLTSAGGPTLRDPLRARCGGLGTEPGAAQRLDARRPRGRRGPLDLQLRHRLVSTGTGPRENLLEGTLTLHNTSDRPQTVSASFLTVTPTGPLYLPLSAAGLAGDRRFAALGVSDFLRDCRQVVGATGLTSHYLEPAASTPDERTTRALLLAPVVDVATASAGWHAALFTASDQAMRFRVDRAGPDELAWEVGRVLTVAPGATASLRCWLLLHRADAATAWRAFHRHGHREEHPPVGWLRDLRVHYYDFLSSADGKSGRRGDGYEADLPHFQAFHVGLATQHGYYPHLGDYVHPDRPTWRAMPGDPRGAVPMSLDRMRRRITATRAAGVRAAVYLHPALLDDGGPSYAALRDCVQIDAEGRPVPFPWQGPDTAGRNWRASLAAPAWRAHLLQQAEWIMDLLRPDALVIDETFAGIGYDHHPDRAGPLSGAAIDWHRQLRSLVRAYGDDRAVLVSDCSRSPFVLWADGEAGDHAYPRSLGNPLYRQEPVRYLAALGDKPWRPCAWHFRGTWDLQMALARQVGAGVGVSNGWIEYTGLHGLSGDDRHHLITDIESLL